MEPPAKEFAKLLQAGITAIAKRTSKPKGVIRDELGYAIGRNGGSAIEYWVYGDGRIPSRQEEVEALARILVEAGGLDRIWLAAFLESAGYANRAQLVADLFPDASDQRPHNLPAQLTPLIGREEELQEIIHRLLNPGRRLLTLTGMGGVGKTRLALAAAEGLVALAQPSFADGIWFVPLAEVRGNFETAIEAVVAAVAKALDLTAGAAPEHNLLEYLRLKQLLLVLDNFEHLSESTPFIIRLLRTAPNVKLLVTSRASLKLTLEAVINLGGLAVPEDDVVDTVRFPSVQLFLEQAKRKNKSFIPDAAEHKALVQVCQLVQGLPLAILQAASWTNDFTCVDIYASVQENLDFLTTNAPDLPEQHRSMRAMFEYSWSMLSPHEQQVLTQLTVFRGAFNRKAALAITDANLSDLLILTNKSLLEQPAPGIYRLHELLRQFAEKLTDVRQQQAYCRRHAEFYLTLLHTQGSALSSTDMADAIREIKFALDNIRQAWDWALNQAASEPRFLNPLLDSSRTLMSFYDMIGSLWEGEQRFGQAVAILSGTSKGFIAELKTTIQGTYTQLQAQWAYFLVLRGDYERGGKIAQAVIEAAQKTADFYCQVIAILALGRALASRGRYQEASDKFEIGFLIAHQICLYREEIMFLIELGLTRLHYSDHENAQNYFERALLLARQVKDRQGEARGLGNLGRVRLNKGEYDAAQEYFRQEFVVTEGVHDLNTARALGALGWLAHKQGNNTEALQHYQQSLAMARRLGHVADLTRALRGLAWAAYLDGDYDKADAYFEESLQIARKAGHQRAIAVTLNNWGLVLDLQGKHVLAQRRFTESLDIFHKLGAHQSIANALINLAFSLLSTGESTMAKLHLHQALATAHEIGAKAIVDEAVAGYARLHLALGNAIRSTELVAVVMTNSSTPYEIIETRLNPLKRELEIILPMGQINTKLVSGNQSDLNTIVEQLLNEN